MKLRTKLIILQATLLGIVGLITAGWMITFVKHSIPVMEKGIKNQVHACLMSMSSEADVALASADQNALKKVIERCNLSGNEKGNYVAILSTSGKVLISRGKQTYSFARKAKTLDIWREENAILGKTPVHFEGVVLGSLCAQYSTSRIKRWKTSVSLMTTLALVLVFVSGLVSVLFALHLIKPLRSMINYVHEVAEGNLDDREVVEASDELGQLATDLKAMTTKLRESREVISDTSRKAGMADVVTSILHNIGNVLNSVSVSSDIVVEQVKNSKLPALKKLSNLLSDQNDIVSFFKDNPKGKKTPDFLSALSDALAEEHEKIATETKSLNENIDHIKAIIATQQQQAKSNGLWEYVKIETIIHTALQIVYNALTRHGAKIKTNFDSIPDVYTDRHKVLQIIVNLLTNAYQAIKIVSHKDKCVEVTLAHSNQTHIAITVKDNGVGIAEENLNRIFQHGFSTKEDGHGFGLHASANAAVELGGRLSCQSDGEGKGASFTLTLPFKTKESV